jgi:hypothetical protein
VLLAYSGVCGSQSKSKQCQILQRQTNMNIPTARGQAMDEELKEQQPTAAGPNS